MAAAHQLQAPVLQRAQLFGAQPLERSITDEPFIAEASSIIEEKPDVAAKLPIPQDLQAMAEGLSRPGLRSLAVSGSNPALANLPGLPVNPGFNGSGFDGLTHRDQRLSNGGNQFSIEPPNPSIAVGNGLVLEGVNNAIQVYSASGSPLLPQAVSSNQVFGLAPAINRTTKVRGPILTDMRVFYDQGINRWFVLQRSLDSDSSGNSLNRSHLYIAVNRVG